MLFALAMLMFSSVRLVIAAEGEASRFTQVLDEYHKAPGVTRDRLYIDAMEQVLSRSTKLMIDQSAGGNNVMYLPLDRKSVV